MSDTKDKVASLKNGGKGFINEFKNFILRRNVIDLAVGVIIGAAFQKIINSLVEDVIMPIVSLFTGGIDFSNNFLSLDGSHYKTLLAAKKAGALTLNYGNFITAVINFILMALVIFVMIKLINKLSESLNNKMGEEKTTKTCIYCKSIIAIDATRCPNCTSILQE